MSDMKKILFLTGTRADFGKLKPLMDVVQNDDQFECRVFITGMHTLQEYGFTAKEVLRRNYDQHYTFVNQILSEPMDLILANTVQGLGRYVHDSPPDAIVIHGDRIEAMAGAIVGALRNILTIHVEGGEVSGTIDELIRHSVSKLSHVHMVANEEASTRLMQLGEAKETIHVIGSPDIDVMLSPDLPSLNEVRERYEIDFDQYGIACLHPVTTETHLLEQHSKDFFDGLIESNDKFVLIYPNNDDGAETILRHVEELRSHENFRVIPSLRFEYFLTLLKNCEYIIGNSSAAIREAPVYGIPTVNVGTRQQNRFVYESIIDVEPSKESVMDGIQQAKSLQGVTPTDYFGKGDSANLFAKVLHQENFWDVSKQKVFVDVPLSIQ